MNYATPPVRVLLQLSRDNLLHINTIHHEQWRNRRGQRGELPRWQVNLKNRSPT